MADTIVAVTPMKKLIDTVWLIKIVEINGVGCTMHIDSQQYEIAPGMVHFFGL